MTDLIKALEEAEKGIREGHWKRCAVCGDHMRKGRTVPLARWATRRFCSHACHYASMKGVTPETASDALLRRIDITAPGGCHVWTGSKSRDGYGSLTFQNKKRKAHRLAYETWVGPIGTGMCVCHRCDNRLCINPRHLFLGTNADNTADRDQKGRQAKGERCGRAKLTEADVRAIRLSSDTHAALSKRYGVGATSIWEIKAGRSWAHVV